jgi:hypothetical protein
MVDQKVFYSNKQIEMIIKKKKKKKDTLSHICNPMSSKKVFFFEKNLRS